MLFDIRQFEQIIKERHLKKGLGFFERGQLELVEKRGSSEFHFVAKANHLLLEKRGYKLLHYTCSCVISEYCEHLSAALFYFQQEALGIEVRQKTNKGKKQYKKTAPSERLQAKSKKSEQRRLQTFIENADNTLSATQIFSFLSATSGITLVDVLYAQMEYLLNPCLKIRVWNQQMISRVTKLLCNFINHNKAQKFGASGGLYLNLAIVKLFMRLYTLRFTGLEESLFDVYKQALKELEGCFKKGLTLEEREQWFRITLVSVASNKNLLSEAFMFLVPRFVSVSENEQDFVLLYTHLAKRAYKKLYYHAFDVLEIVRRQVNNAAREKVKVSFLSSEPLEGAESVIADYGLLVCSGKVNEAFLLLDKNLEIMKARYKHQYDEYLNYVIVQAREQNKAGAEYKYLRESFIQHLFILPTRLERFLELVPKEQQRPVIQELVKDIRDRSQAYGFDKIHVLLLSVNMLDELMKELDKQNNRFSVVHELALRKLPEISNKFLTLYMRHLSETLRANDVYSHQLEVFKTAKSFLDKLPRSQVIGFIQKLSDQIGKAGLLYRYIHDVYEIPFLR